MRRVVCWTVLAAGLSGTAVASGAWPAETPLVPRAAFFALRDKTAVQLSPNGGHVGWIDLTARRALTVLARGTGQTPRVILASPTVAFQWTFRQGEMLVVRSADGKQQLLLVPLQGRPTVLVEGAAVGVAALGVDRPDEAVLTVRGGSGVGDGFVRLNLDTRALQPIPELAGYSTAFFDGRLRLVAAQRQTPTTIAIDRRTPDGWAPLQTVHVVDAVSAGIVAVSRDGSRIAFTTNERSDTTQLDELDVATGTRRTLVRDPRADVLRVGASINPADGTVQSVVSYHVRMLRHVLDRSMLDHFSHLETVGRGEVSVAGQSLDNRTWLVRFFDGGPARFAIYDLGSRAITPLFSEAPGMESVPLASRHAIELKARDGLPLRADVYLPAGSDANRDGIPDAPLPTVLFVHGGPWVGFEWNIWDANRHFQLLANRGYAVIRTSFRGEPGHGRAFVDAGDRQWGGAMITDLMDIAAHATKLGIADPKRTGMFGWSFGGMATAMALAKAPDQFRCGLALYGVYDIPSFMETPIARNDFWRQRVGDIADAADRKRLETESPITHAASIARPLLISHGAGDSRVPMAQSERFAQALTVNRQPATFVVFPDEEHDYYAPATWTAFWAIAERFLAEHLRGRYEPAANELSAVKIDVRSGAEHIPGLKAMLGK